MLDRSITQVGRSTDRRVEAAKVNEAEHVSALVLLWGFGGFRVQSLSVHPCYEPRRRAGRVPGHPRSSETRSPSGSVFPSCGHRS